MKVGLMFRTLRPDSGCTCTSGWVGWKVGASPSSVSAPMESALFFPVEGEIRPRRQHLSREMDGLGSGEHRLDDTRWEKRER
jgi:hypothetical protein